MSDWSRKQFAMEMVAGGSTITHAVAVVREFDIQWAHEEAYDKALTESLLASSRALGDTKATSEETHKAVAAARAAGDRARKASIAMYEEWEG